MKSPAAFVLAVGCGILMLPTKSFAVERYAYLFWGDDNSMVRVPLPGTPPSEPQSIRVTPFDDVDWIATGSTSAGPDSFFSLELGSNHLVEYSPLSLSHAVVATLDIDVYFDDLVHGPNGELVLSHRNQLYDVDTESGSVTLRAQLPNGIDPWTIEFHHGAFYAGSGTSFVQIDPQTHEVSVIHHWPGAFYLWGLSSIGGNLWYGSSAGFGGSDQSYIGTIDPATGTTTPYIYLFDETFGDAWVALEVFEQQTPAVPAMLPLGVALLVIVLGVAGVLALRRP